MPLVTQCCERHCYLTIGQFYSTIIVVETTFIYALNCPETGECRYVGKANNPRERFTRHLSEAKKKNYHVSNWIKSLTVRGLQPLLEILDEVPNDAWKSWERAWIKISREIGMSLTNGTDGGTGFGSGENHHLFGKPKENHPHFGKLGEKNHNFGLRRTAAERKKMGLAKKGKKHTPEHRANRRTKRPGASSSFRGVSWHLATQKWAANIKLLTKVLYLGSFPEELEAAKAYDVAAKIHHGEHAVLNFP